MCILSQIFLEWLDRQSKNALSVKKLNDIKLSNSNYNLIGRLQFFDNNDFLGLQHKENTEGHLIFVSLLIFHCLRQTINRYYKYI